MDAAVSLSLSLPLHHAHAALPLPLPAPHHHNHNHCAVPLTHHSASSSANAPSSKAAHAQAPPAARLSLAVAVAARPRSPSSPVAAASPAPSPPVARSSSRAATGYAAALADACARAGTLRRAARHARALLVRRPERVLEEANAVDVGKKRQQVDARVAALVRMLVAKGNTGMVVEALAEFAAICDHLMPHQPPRARHAAY